MELSKHRKIFYNVEAPRFYDPLRAGEDTQRVSLLPLPETVVGPVATPHSFVRDYYFGEDEVLADDDLSEIDRFAYQQWELDKIDNPEYPENEDWEPSLDYSDED